jgi:hypothetical protein
MKTNPGKIFMTAALAALIVGGTGCNRQTRGNADANAQSRAASPQEGGATSTAGSAGESKNFGNTRAKQEQDGKSPSASPSGVSKDAEPGQAGGAINPPNTKMGTGK